MDECTYYDRGRLSLEAYDFIEDATRRYGDDVALYTDLCKGASSVLELGSGTGRVALDLAKAGFNVTGLELSAGMIAKAEAKREKLGPELKARCRFVQANMASFSLSEKFDRILIPYRSFNHLTKPEQQVACLSSVRRHMAPEGLGAVHLAMVDNPAKLVDPDELHRSGHKRIRVGSTDKLVHWEIVSREIDLLEQTLKQEVRIRYQFLNGATLREDSSKYVISWITRREAAHLLIRCGLVIIAEYSDGAKSPPKLNADHIIVFRVDEQR